MIEERLGRDILVGTRAGGVRTGGHNTRAGVGKSPTRHNNVYKYKLPQGDLAPKGMFELGVTEPTFRACRCWVVRSALFESLRPRCLLTSLACRACLARLEDVACHACRTYSNPLTADGRWGCYVEDTGTETFKGAPLVEGS